MSHRLVEIRIPNDPETDQVRWRLAGVTVSKNLLVCLESTDTDFCYDDIIDVKKGEEIWNWRPYSFDDGFNNDPPEVA